MKGQLDAEAETQLRILRQGLAAQRGGRTNLLLRGYVLRRVRQERAVQCLPELRRRVCTASDSAGGRAATGSLPRKTTRLDQASPPEALAPTG